MMEAACYSESVYIRLHSGVFQKALIPTGTAVRTLKRNFSLDWRQVHKQHRGLMGKDLI
jgi:hypothetical protein